MDLGSLSLSLFTPGLSGSGTDVSGTLLGTLYGGGVSAGAGSGSDPVAALGQALKTETKGVAAAAKQPQTAREIAAFKAAVASAKTPAALLANPDALKVLLTANGLGSQAQYGALASKALLSDTSKSKSLASQLSNAQWLTVAKTFDFANKGLSVLKSPAVLASVTSGYAEVQWRTSLDQSTPGLSTALDFRSRASTIKSVDQILGDPTFRTVVTTALGLPQQIAFQSLQAQEHAVSSRIDLAQFKKPAFVDQFTKRYLIEAQATGAGGASGSGVASLFA